MQKKKNTAIFIDGENISAKKANIILQEARKRGVIDFAKVYGLQKDNRTKQWSDVAKSNAIVKDIRLYGTPSKNKVDSKIIKDTIHDVKIATNVDIVIIVTSDHGYSENVRELRAMGKRVVVMGETKTPERLRLVSNEFVLI